MEITQQKPKFIEARQFFRIDDQIRLTFRLVDNNELTAPNYAFDVAAMDPKHHRLLTALHELNKGTEENLHKIADHNPLVANYLRSLEKKIQLLSRAIIYKSDPAAIPLRQVNISESGIAFGVNDAIIAAASPTHGEEAGVAEDEHTHGIKVGRHIRLTLQLAPIADEIAIYGKIVRVELTTNNPAADQRYPYWIAIQFSHMDGADSQLLARYILYQQVAQRKKIAEQTN